MIESSKDSRTKETGKDLDAAISREILGWEPVKLSDGREVLTPGGAWGVDWLETRLSMIPDLHIGLYCNPYCASLGRALELCKIVRLEVPAWELPESPGDISRLCLAKHRSDHSTEGCLETVLRNWEVCRIIAVELARGTFGRGMEPSLSPSNFPYFDIHYPKKVDYYTEKENIVVEGHVHVRLYNNPLNPTTVFQANVPLERIAKEFRQGTTKDVPTKAGPSLIQRWDIKRVMEDYHRVMGAVERLARKKTGSDSFYMGHHHSAGKFEVNFGMDGSDGTAEVTYEEISNELK